MKFLEKMFAILGYEVTIKNKRKLANTKVALPSSPEVKHKMINGIAKTYQLDILVETGTYLGGLIYAVRNNFKEIHTIELAEELFINAVQKFEPYSHIHPIFGDSGKVLYELVPNLKKPALFWLDGHYSGGFTAKGEQDAPVGQELDAIIQAIQKGIPHLILIDDARLFINDTSYSGYPRMKEIERLVAEQLPNYNISVESDVIIIKN